MADQRESFPILEDVSTSNGVALHRKNVGDPVAGSNEAPVLASKDASGNFQHFCVADEGDAPPSDILPVLVAKDNSGNLAFIPLNAQGKVPVSFDFGDEKSANATVLGVLSTQTEVCKITLTADKVYEKLEFLASCTRSVLWQLVQKDDAAETTVAEAITGPGQFSIYSGLKNLKITAGSTGTQELILYGTQLSGPASDMHGTVGAVELP